MNYKGRILNYAGGLLGTMDEIMVNALPSSNTGKANRSTHSALARGPSILEPMLS